jgi:hypothetical protein
MKKNNPTIYLKALVFIVLLIAQTYTFSQTVYVPYRVGNKFGIADENGKMIIKPQFDILEPHWKLNHCFYGFTKTDSNVLSSVIYNNKIIISKQKYDYYYVYHSLILAYEYLIVNKKVLMDGDNVKQRNHLYNSDGVKVLNGNLKPSIYTVNWIGMD